MRLILKTKGTGGAARALSPEIMYTVNAKVVQVALVSVTSTEEDQSYT